MSRFLYLMLFFAVVLLPMAVPAGDSRALIPMHDRGLKTYYVRASVPGFGDMDLLVDTGSGYTVINEQALRMLKKHGNAVYVKKLSSVMADGSRTTVPVYSIRGVTVGGKCRLDKIEAAVLPGKSRMILGLSALRKSAPFTFSVEPPQLTLSNCHV